MELKDLTGRHVLSGIETGNAMFETSPGYMEDAQYVKFCLDGVCYMAVEDPEDGYRSCCKELVISDEPCKIALPNVLVVGRMDDSNALYQDDDILVLTDVESGLDVLRIGTANTCDYYPCYVAEWMPENLACNRGRGVSVCD